MRLALGVVGLVVLQAMAAAQGPFSEFSHRIEQFRSDLGSLSRTYPIQWSATRAKRMESFYSAALDEAGKVDPSKWSIDGQIDLALFTNYLQRELSELRTDNKRREEILPLMPFAQTIIDFEESRRKFEKIKPSAVADQLNDLKKAIEAAGKDLEKKKVSKSVANRAVGALGSLKRHFEDWNKFYTGYDPLFSWWCEAPFKAAVEALDKYTNDVRDKLVGIKPDDKTTIIGDPIGDEALREALKFEMIPYTPDELVKIANSEFAWCEKEMLRASEELGYGKEWKKALEHVKRLHVEPGDQPQLIKDLALEAIEFLEQRDLVTIPALAKETWRMEMLSPQAQLQSPFFLGGEMIQVSFPTDTMAHEAKLMSLRGNNKYFSRATVQHELIPGHHLQQFMQSRYRGYRGLFNTPFWVEGWALYWEMRLWDLDFAKSPEERIGMLFWRMHRCARIIFSLSFHLGKMTPQECVDFLVDRVGHERDNAAAEVRRSFAGTYPPLYQAAYMLGGLQIRELYKEAVSSGKMKERDFHDAILQGNTMPIEMVRAMILKQGVKKGFVSSWRFYPGLIRNSNDH